MKNDLKYFNPLDFNGKKILITGASSGIGRAAAIYLSRLGAKIVVVGRNKDKITDTVKYLSGGSISLFCAI